jgi:hypothetical protein
VDIGQCCFWAPYVLSLNKLLKQISFRKKILSTDEGHPKQTNQQQFSLVNFKCFKICISILFIFFLHSWEKYGWEGFPALTEDSALKAVKIK